MTAAGFDHPTHFMPMRLHRLLSCLLLALPAVLAAQEERGAVTLGESVAGLDVTPRDGHGHHQVSGQLAREVFDAAADTVRFPRGTTLGLGAWSPSKFYRAARFAPQEAALAFNVGELSPYRGLTYAEIASQSRS